MLEAISSLFLLRWSNKPILHPLPSTILRTYITNPSRPNDRLELLSSQPQQGSTTSSPSSPPTLFLHGGLGNAAVWLPFMTYLHITTPQTQTFALSTRNHGASTSLPFLSMVYGTTMYDLVSDITTAVNHITTTTGQTPILVAHSSAGGLVSYLLSSNQIPKVPGLVLLGAVPHFGNIGAYVNWAKIDPWFFPRMLFHLYHPISPLSSVALVRNAFFGPGTEPKREVVSDEHVRDFMKWMPPYESLMWPLQMRGSIWGAIRGRQSWIDVRKVIAGIDVDAGSKEDKVLVLNGEYDRIVDPVLAERVAVDYRVGFAELKALKKVDGAEESTELEELDGTMGERKDGVRYVVVRGAGHHTQNDVQWETAAEALRRFVVQI